MGFDLRIGRDLIMPMKNPPRSRPESTKDAEALGRDLSKAQTAGGPGVTRQELYRLIRGKEAITPEMAIRLEKSIGGTGDIALRARLGRDLTKARASRNKGAPAAPKKPEI
jgi:antitoxin HigA-1